MGGTCCVFSGQLEGKGDVAVFGGFEKNGERDGRGNCANSSKQQTAGNDVKRRL